nr:glycerophosphodiester phosphodiesterase domain-containing protein 4-like [Anolis sagrei ordinatus]
MKEEDKGLVRPVDSAPITTKTSRHGSARVIPPYPVHQDSHQPFIFCLVGLYSCRWKKYSQKTARPGQCCCGKDECLFFTLLLLAFSLWFIFLYMWSEAKNDYHNFDGYAYGNLGFWFQWSTFVLFLALFLFLYILFLVVLALCLLLESQQLYLYKGHKAAVTVFLCLSIFGLGLITLLWHKQWNTFYLSFQITAPFFHLGAICAMIILAWPVSLHFFRMKSKVMKVFILFPYLAILLLLLFIPLGLYSPCIREKGTLGPKPELIGHRGAPMVAPENTEMSFVKGIEHGAYGLETDVTISFDGIPFLMHDSTLKRTTNVRSLYPEFMNEEAAMFPWSHLEKLNSGRWFFEKRPFFGMPPLSHADRQLARRQKIYKFVDFVKLADRHNKSIIFDLYRPPKYHPYRNSYVHLVEDVLRVQAKIKPHLVLWLTNTNRKYVQVHSPGFQQVSGHEVSIPELKAKNIVKLNLDYRTLTNIDFQKYAEANITINLWVVSEPWLFSLAWCYGVNSVTTDAVHTLKALNQPYFLMTPHEYRTMWIIIDVVAIVLVCFIFGLLR